MLRARTVPVKPFAPAAANRKRYYRIAPSS
jgi:hypothetical protein